MDIKIKQVSTDEIWTMESADVKAFLADSGVIFVKKFWSEEKVDAFRGVVKRFAAQHAESWHPLADDSPSYHRFNNEYEKSYVKARVHQFQFHLWQGDAGEVIELFSDLFGLRKKLLGLKTDHFMTQLPSEGFASRVSVNHYPRGGGYMAEHQDPVHEFNQIQTLIMGSRSGKDKERDRWQRRSMRSMLY